MVGGSPQLFRLAHEIGSGPAVAEQSVSVLPCVSTVPGRIIGGLSKSAHRSGLLRRGDGLGWAELFNDAVLCVLCWEAHNSGPRSGAAEAGDDEERDESAAASDSRAVGVGEFKGCAGAVCGDTA